MKEEDIGDTQSDDLAALNFKLYAFLTSSSPAVVAIGGGGESEVVNIYSLNLSNVTKFKRTSLD